MYVEELELGYVLCMSNARPVIFELLSLLLFKVVLSTGDKSELARNNLLKEVPILHVLQLYVIREHQVDFDSSMLRNCPNVVFLDRNLLSLRERL